MTALDYIGVPNKVVRENMSLSVCDGVSDSPVAPSTGPKPRLRSLRSCRDVRGSFWVCTVPLCEL